MGRSGLEGRDEPRRAVGGTYSTTRVKDGGRGAGKGKITPDKGKEQESVRLNAPVTTGKDRGRQLGAGLQQQPRQSAQGRA